MAVMRYTRDVEDLPRFFQDAVNSMFSSEPSTRPWMPPVDIFETENSLVLKADLPEVKMDDIEIKIENGTLVLKGERKFTPAAEGNGNTKGIHRIERGYGAFTRYFTLPDTVDPEKVEAHFNAGVLTITLNKKEVAKPKTIKVQVSNS